MSDRMDHTCTIETDEFTIKTTSDSSWTAAQSASITYRWISEPESETSYVADRIIDEVTERRSKHF